MIRLTDNPISSEEAVAAVRSPHAGAVVLFLGTTREQTGNRITHSLDYECYAEMARAELARLEADARARWPLIGVAMIHRLGRVAVGETSVAVAVSSPHRQAAFEAGQWLIDRLKETVPIWKRDNGPEGNSRWVHPGIESETAASESR